MKTTRRKFLELAGYGAGAAMLPMAGLRKALACAPAGLENLVVVYLRGGADPLFMVTPTPDMINNSDPDILDDFFLNTAEDTDGNPSALGRQQMFNHVSSYAGTTYGRLEHLDEDEDPITTQLDVYSDPPAGRPTRASSAGNDGDYTFHPAMTKFQELYKKNELAIVLGVGGTNNRSHFSAQDATELARPVTVSAGTGDELKRQFGTGGSGWLYDTNYYYTGEPSTTNDYCGLSAYAANASVPLSLAGSPGLGIASVESLYNFELPGTYGEDYATLLAAMYEDVTLNEARSRIRSAGAQMLVADDELPGGDSSRSGFSGQMADIAELINEGAALNTRIFTADLGAWDTHTRQLEGQSSAIARLNSGLTAFMDTIDPTPFKNTCILIMSEFGRTMDMNGTNGTDHGDGGIMYIISGSDDFTGEASGDPGKGGTVINHSNYMDRWADYDNFSTHSTNPGFRVGVEADMMAGTPASYRYYQPILTDFRAVYADILYGHLGITTDAALKDIFGAGSLPSSPVDQADYYSKQVDPLNTTTGVNLKLFS